MPDVAAHFHTPTGALPDVAAQFHVGNIGAAAAAPRASRAGAAALRQRARQRLATGAAAAPWGGSRPGQITHNVWQSKFNQVRMLMDAIRLLCG